MARLCAGRGRAADKRKPCTCFPAYAHAAGVVIGQRCVDGKSNEITAIPQHLETMTIDKAIVTIDAMGAQKAVAQAILSKNADYIRALKENQSSLYPNSICAGSFLVNR